MNRVALIVAGGSGQRMQTAVPKQFLLLAGKPVLMRTLEKFSKYQIVLVLPEQHISYWQMLCKQYNFLLPHTLVSGGATRAESVFLGLQHITDDSLVAIHDGVRPLLPESMIERGFLVAQEKGNAVPVIPLADSIRQVSSSSNQTVPRSNFRLVQTPQIFLASEIKHAYRNSSADIFTDDASILEADGKTIFLYDGDPINIKITTPADLHFAESCLC